MAAPHIGSATFNRHSTQALNLFREYCDYLADLELLAPELLNGSHSMFFPPDSQRGRGYVV
jgi:hypothetical protein